MHDQIGPELLRNLEVKNAIDLQVMMPDQNSRAQLQAQIAKIEQINQAEFGQSQG